MLIQVKYSRLNDTSINFFFIKEYGMNNNFLNILIFSCPLVAFLKTF